MRFFYDTEFLEDGDVIDLISIGIKAETGDEYYAVNSDMPVGRIGGHDWLCKNVVPHLPLDSGGDEISEYFVKKLSFNEHDPLEFELDKSDRDVKPAWIIAREVEEFLTRSHMRTLDEIELWADYGAYDHVRLMQLWGPMMKKPLALPMYTNDLQQLWRAKGQPNEVPEQDPSGKHHAMFDAIHDQDLFDFLAPLPYSDWPRR